MLYCSHQCRTAYALTWLRIWNAIWPIGSILWTNVAWGAGGWYLVATTVHYSPNQEEALRGPKLCQGSLLSVVFGPDDSVQVLRVGWWPGILMMSGLTGSVIFIFELAGCIPAPSQTDWCRKLMTQIHCSPLNGSTSWGRSPPHKKTQDPDPYHNLRPKHQIWSHPSVNFPVTKRGVHPILGPCLS